MGRGAQQRTVRRRPTLASFTFPDELLLDAWIDECATPHGSLFELALEMGVSVLIVDKANRRIGALREADPRLVEALRRGHRFRARIVNGPKPLFHTVAVRPIGRGL